MIEVEERAAERIRLLPDALALRMVAEIDRLGETNATRTCVHGGPLDGRMLHSFVVESDPRVLRIGVLYVFQDDERVLVITQIAALLGDEDDLRLASTWPP